MVSLTDINARLAAINTGIMHIQIEVDIIYIYPNTLITHTVSLIFTTLFNTLGNL